MYYLILFFYFFFFFNDTATTEIYTLSLHDALPISLDDSQLRTLDERLRYLRELEERRIVILNSIRDQGKLDDALATAIRAANSKSRLEDIYLPFKPKRRTKAEIAKEAGLEPLADLLLTRPENDPSVAAMAFIIPRNRSPTLPPRSTAHARSWSNVSR